MSLYGSPFPQYFMGGQFQWQPKITLATDSQSHEPLEANADRWPFLLLNPVTGTTFFFTLAATAIGVSGLSKVPTFVLTLAATAIGVAVMTRVPTFLKTLAATAVGVATLNRKQFVTMTATAVGAAGLTRANLYTRTLAVTAASVASLTTAVTFVQTLAATAVGVAVLSPLYIAGSAARYVWNKIRIHIGMKI